MITTIQVQCIALYKSIVTAQTSAVVTNVAVLTNDCLLVSWSPATMLL